MNQCYFCGESVDDDSYCFGCKEYICSYCWGNPRRGYHGVDEHTDLSYNEDDYIDD